MVLIAVCVQDAARVSYTDETVWRRRETLYPVWKSSYRAEAVTDNVDVPV